MYDRYGIDAVKESGGASGFGGMDGFSSSEWLNGSCDCHLYLFIVFGGGDMFSSFFDGGLFGGGRS